MRTVEEQRLEEESRREVNWKRWGPYLSERQWGTVREDYSENGDAWEYFPYDQARSRAYRWGEDGLLGITDRECRLCFSLGLWNHQDDHLKERLFGLSNPQGNHGEDVKELYYYLDSTPTHSYFKGLYKYPQAAFPYEWLLSENHEHRGFNDREFEIADTGIFDEDRYFDVFAEYAKAGANDILIRVTVHNRGPEPVPLTLLGQLWVRNTWTWGCDHEGCWAKPRLSLQGADQSILVEHESLNDFTLQTGQTGEHPQQFLFTENESNNELLFGTPNDSQFTKDAFHRFLVNGETSAVNPENTGTKAAAVYQWDIPAGEKRVVEFRLTRGAITREEALGEEFDAIFEKRQEEADTFYAQKIPGSSTEEEKQVQRQAYAGLLWSKQFYHYSVHDWLKGDDNMPKPPDSRWQIRNEDWQHLYNRDVLSMPDKWEYPWYAIWDSAFHMIPFSRIDPHFAKSQLTLFLREWYMHPNGQIPAYEYGFNDVNPPVHAWACWRVYKMSDEPTERDVTWLAACFHKLLINFTWWVNRKDPDGKNLFSGGFLGLDNIGIFDRNHPLPTGGELAQADGTAWMAFFCNTMLSISLELASRDPAYDGIASKFFEHFVNIADAINDFGGPGLWDEEDGFYYDQIHKGHHETIPLKIRSIVGLIPLIAAEVLDDHVIARLPGFRKRMAWFIENRPDLASRITHCERSTHGTRRLLAIPSRERLERALRYMLDEREFLSPYGIRSLSKIHEHLPFTFHDGNQEHFVRYLPAESDSGLFGGNSNWRGPVWFPINFLLIEALQRYHLFYGDDFKVEFPTGSGNWLTLNDVSQALSRRLCKLFLPGDDGQRPVHGVDRRYADNPHFKDLVLFYEYFHGDNGRGVGASHQTGWTSLVAKLLHDQEIHTDDM